MVGGNSEECLRRRDRDLHSCRLNIHQASRAGAIQEHEGHNLTTSEEINPMNAEAVSMRPDTAGSDDEPESDVETITAGRTSFEVAQDGHELLQEEEEREKLLMGDADQEGLRRIFVGNNGEEDVRAGRRRGMKQKKSGKSDRKRRRRRRDSASVYEMEEGGQSSSSLSSTSSSESDQQRLGNFQVWKALSINVESQEPVLTLPLVGKAITPIQSSLATHINSLALPRSPICGLYGFK